MSRPAGVSGDEQQEPSAQGAMTESDAEPPPDVLAALGDDAAGAVGSPTSQQLEAPPGPDGGNESSPPRSNE
jgi:hypothetical protein